MKKIKLLLFTLTITVVSMAQPCLSGWKYRKAFDLNNSFNASSLSSFQVRLRFNSQLLITNGKLKPDGSDLRLTDHSGASIPFWLDISTLNTANTEVWLKIPSIPSYSSSMVYMFYGAASANTISSGVSTFELFDDFFGSSLDGSRWAHCGSGGFSVSGGAVTLSSTGSKSVLQAAQPLTGEFVVHADVTNIANSGFVGISDISNTNGYAMTFGLTPFSNIELKRSTSSCFNLVNTSPIKADNSITEIGQWSYSWNTLGSHNYTWPGGSIYNYPDISTPYPASRQVTPTIGIQNTSGSITINTVFARKYAAVEPTISEMPGEDTIQVPSVEISNNSPVCNGDTIKLSVPSLASTSYSWLGPNGYFSTDSVVNIPHASAINRGNYTLQISASGGCTFHTYLVHVEVTDSTEGGVLSNSDTVCYNSNKGTIKLRSQIGDIIRWETSPSGKAPWTTVHNTTDSLNYENKQLSSYYQAIVKNGGCKEKASTSALLKVSPLSKGGNLIGEKEICQFIEGGRLSLTDQIGKVENWQFSEDNGATWGIINRSTTTLDYSGLDTTRWYRAEVKSGTCNAVFSDTVTITVKPTPQVRFNVTDVCEGNESIFMNTTFILGSPTVVSYTWDFDDGTGERVENPIHIYSNPLTYRPTLTVVADGCSYDTTMATKVNPTPKVGFTYEDICEQSPTRFTNLSTLVNDTIVGFDWEFQKDSLSTLENPSYTFDTASTYPVKLKVTSHRGCADSIAKDVVINPLPIVHFVVDSICLDQEAKFINNTRSNSTNVRYDWAFGDANTSVLKHPSHKYATENTYTVLLKATTHTNCINTYIDSIVVSPLPQIDYTFDNHCKGDSLRIINNSTISAGTIHYNWSLGDGLTDTAKAPRHLYNVEGYYPIQVTATSNIGCTSFATKPVEVFPVPDVAFIALNACADEEMIFDNLTKIAYGNVNYLWDFDNGDTSRAISPVYTYTSDGVYGVQLTATSDSGCVRSLTKNVIAYPNPVASFVTADVCDGTEAIFTNTSTISSGIIDTYIWDFGDGVGSSTIKSPTYPYLNYGIYQARLVITSDQGCQDSVTQTIHVNEVPIADFDFENVCFNDPITFNNTSFINTGSITYKWHFGDGDTSVIISPSHVYDAPDLYPVKLTVTSNHKCVDSITKGARIYELPIVDAGKDTTIRKGASLQLESTGGINCLWLPFESLNNSLLCSPWATPLETTAYTVTSEDNHGCSSSDTVVITVDNDFFVEPSNVMTPNGNLDNDTWYIGNILNYPSNKITVLDRSGRVVFQEKEYKNNWGGTFNGDILPDGTYYYIIQFSKSDKVYKGALTILRNE